MKNVYLLFILLAVMGLLSVRAQAAISVTQGYDSQTNALFTIQLDDEKNYAQDDVSMKLMASLGAVTDMTVLDSIQIDVEKLIKKELKKGRTSFLIRLKSNEINNYVDKYELDSTAARQLKAILR